MKKIHNIKKKSVWLLCQLGIMGIIFYQKVISPAIPARCRYYPTCSEYGKQALRHHGFFRGSKLMVKRFCRCHPWGGSGIDFVPLPLYRYNYMLVNKDELVFHFIYQDTFSYRVRINDLW